jgi:hypothetical protein
VCPIPTPAQRSHFLPTPKAPSEAC